MNLAVTAGRWTASIGILSPTFSEDRPKGWVTAQHVRLPSTPPARMQILSRNVALALDCRFIELNDDELTRQSFTVAILKMFALDYENDNSSGIWSNGTVVYASDC